VVLKGADRKTEQKMP